MQTVEEINDTVSQLIFQIKLLALGDVLSALEQCRCPLVDVLQEILSRCFQ
jgi:hypothetical protein